MTVPLFDCSLGEDVVRALDPVWQSGRLASGAGVTALEDRLSRYLQGRPVVAMSDMTQALCLALRLAGIGPGDEVLTLAFNCMSSNSAIAMVGATPVWLDVDPNTATVDVEQAATLVTERTRAVVVYHIAGYVGDLGALRQLCDRAGLLLIEDANAALGAMWQGRRVGSFGDYAVFSFYANRQLNGIDGAALICPKAKEEEARRLRRFGIDASRFRTADGEIDSAADIPEVGLAAALNNVNASLAYRSMDDLDERLDRNRANVGYLAAGLSDTGLHFIRERDGATGVFWAALVRSADRDRLMADLKDKGVQCSKLHQRNDRYSGLRGRPRDLPGTDVLDREMFALPSGWWLSQGDLDRIVDAVRAGTGR